jgi:acrylyl-CoA reductase (NADPH)
MDFPATVAPFILRGVTLVGINSVFVPMDTRRLAWERIERLVDVSKLRELSQEIGLADALDAAPRLLRGQMKGRLVVDTHRVRRPG